MADCFWTDMVGCVEDCGAPEVAGYYCWDMHSNTGGSDTDRVLTFGATFDDAMGECPPAGDPAFLNLSVIHLVIYTVPEGDGAGCDWNLTLLSTHGETADTDLGGCFSGWVWKDESFYSATASQRSDVDDIDYNYLIPLTEDGQYPRLNFDELLTLAFMPTGSNGVFIATIRDNNTGNLYIGSGVQTTCF